jgi:catechol 2,3-dioxygenase-like lactoylglutathione lyase family enzyme
MTDDTREFNSGQPSPTGVRQLRVVVQVENFDEAVTFYRDALGLPEVLAIDSDHGARVMILDGGRATLELANAAQVDLIDDIEVGRRVSPRIRIAFEVDDAEATTHRLSNAGATIIAEPTTTPWRSLNSRLQAPADLQLTLFQELS